jgi:hypothetical protein
VVLAGPISAQPAPQPSDSADGRPLSLLDVPFISQSEALCGGAAAAMVLRYWGERGLTAESFAHLIDRSAAGIRTTTLVGELQRRGWNANAIEGNAALITNELSRGRPVLILIEDRPGTFHYIVIVAATTEAIVFHDPARAPLRVMGREEFTRRWDAAARWMAVIVPGTASPDTAAPPPVTAGVPAPGSCESLIATGIQRAQANDLDAAERSLTSALSCGGAAALRELAGVRLLQRRWADVEALAATAVQVDPHDKYGWQLLGTSRYVQNNPVEALAAWNRAAEPRIDLVRVEGLTRTRQRVVERLVDASAGEMLTPSSLVLARRRLADLPSAVATRIEYVPVPSALAELRATVNERPIVPTDIWSYAAVGAVAAARREVQFSTGALSGGGERLSASWRFWPERPRVAMSFDAPAPWGGVWGLRAFTERQPFDVPELPQAERTSAGIETGQWIAPAMRLAVRAGFDRWDSAGSFGAAGVSLQVRSPGDRVDAVFSTDVWAGNRSFSTTQAAFLARTSTTRRGHVWVARGGAGLATSSTPPDIWFGGDTGATRATLLRAHPIVANGRLRTRQLGRQIVHASLEAQRWWPLLVTRVGAAVFVDGTHVRERLARGSRADVDAGIGARLSLPVLSGTFRLDVARGLRDGMTKLSFVYEP